MNFSTNPAKRISRRTLLKGLGTTIALPLLDVMEPLSAATKDSSQAPVRLAYLYFPNGAPEGTWEPEKVGSKSKVQKLNEWMSPLEDLKQDFNVFRNFWTPRGNGHGAGTATWLTGGGYNGREVNAGGISCDQITAEHLGKETLVPSLELSTQGEGYFSNDLPRNSISWSRNNTPLPRETHPRLIFDRMFRSTDQNLNKSVLDLVIAQAKTLAKQSSQSDKRKIEEYLESIRSVERRLAFADKQSKEAKKDNALTETLSRPKPGIPLQHQEYVQLMLDLCVLAYWGDATRVTSFMLDHGQSNRYFNFINGVEGTWHALSHWRDISGETEDDDGKTSWKSRTSKKSMYAEVVKWHHQQFAYFLGKLKSVKEGEGTLLDNSLILYGSSLGDGHEHSENNLPLILAGGGGKTKTGQLLHPKKRVSVSKIHLMMLQRAGVKIDEFKDEDEPLTSI